MYKYNIWYLCNALLLLLVLEKKHALLKFLPEIDRLDVCEVTAIAFAFSASL